MKDATPYIVFNGNCEEAMNFYAESFNAKLGNIMRFESAPMPIPEEQKQKVMHTELEADGLKIMASDVMPGSPFIAGNNVTIMATPNDDAEQDRIFEALASNGGQVLMPLENTFWGARFGVVQDKFGIVWQLHLQKEQQN